MFKSLRWRLQVWHAIVLLAVISSFGGIVHQLHWQTRLQQLDAELDRSAGVVMSQLRKLGIRPWRPGRRDVPRVEEQKPEGTQPEVEQGARTESNIAAIPEPPRVEGESDRPNRTLPPLPRDRPFPFRDPGPLPAEFVELFQGEEESRLYFVIWGDKGEVLQKSDSAPEIAFPNLQIGENGLPVRIARDRQGEHVYREVIHAGIFRMNFLVGRSLEKDLAAHHQSGLLLAVMGFVILAAGVLGGGWLSSRAIRPITAMATAAESISAQNLSERIDVKETDSELGQLAKVLNGTFDRLQAAFERQSQFTADASHELRTPLSVILAHSELALSRVRSADDYRATIDTCRRASLRMKSLIDALLLLARFDSGTPSLKQDRLDLASVARDSADLIQTLATERGIRIVCEVTSCEVLGDWDRLSQVVTNLLTNAIRYNRENGSVRVATRVESGKAVVSVVDTGIGIAAEELPHIFDRFYQVDKARSRAEGSCGLGLSICKTIVEAHGGTITAKSQIDQGTTIEVWLPLAERPVKNKESELKNEQLVSSTIS